MAALARQQRSENRNGDAPSSTFQSTTELSSTVHDSQSLGNNQVEDANSNDGTVDLEA